MVQTLTIRARGQGLHDITGEVQALFGRAGLEDGLCTLFLQHTSASLVVQENADPSARGDLERWLDRLGREGIGA